MTAALFHRDIVEFLALLRSHRVSYLVVGGEAVIQYGYARFTGDIDLFYDGTEANARRLHGALVEFWGGAVAGIDEPRALLAKGRVFQFGAPPIRIDLLNEIDGVGFTEAWEARATVRFSYRGQSLSVHFIGLDHLISNKKKAGRPKDLDDLRFLLEARKRQSRKRRGARRGGGKRRRR